jgi:hypothetical protein
MKNQDKQQKAFSEKELLRIGRKHFAWDFPNPERLGCPPENELRLLAEKPRRAKESVLNHISFCSPCYRAYSRFSRFHKTKKGGQRPPRGKVKKSDAYCRNQIDKFRHPKGYKRRTKQIVAPSAARSTKTEAFCNLMLVAAHA